MRKTAGQAAPAEPADSSDGQTIYAVQFIRKMRGGTQAHLLRCSDGRSYVVKFQSNPQHRRILINELVASLILKELQLSVPEAALVRISDDFLRSNPDVFIEVAGRKWPVDPGLHFGSRYPGNPERTPVWDLMPDDLLKLVANQREFLGMLVVDKWLANADNRQVVFPRLPAADRTPPIRSYFRALFVDHGHTFNGRNWTYRDGPLNGLYDRRSVYSAAKSWKDFQPWIDEVLHFPEQVVAGIRNKVPAEWFDGDEISFERLMEQLLERRRKIPDLIRECPVLPNLPAY